MTRPPAFGCRRISKWGLVRWPAPELSVLATFFCTVRGTLRDHFEFEHATPADAETRKAGFSSSKFAMWFGCRTTVTLHAPDLIEDHLGKRKHSFIFPAIEHGETGTSLLRKVKE